jgi:hypothetical protein
VFLESQVFSDVTLHWLENCDVSKDRIDFIFRLKQSEGTFFFGGGGYLTLSNTRPAFAIGT